MHVPILMVAGTVVLDLPGRVSPINMWGSVPEMGNLDAGYARAHRAALVATGRSKATPLDRSDTAMCGTYSANEEKRQGASPDPCAYVADVRRRRALGHCP